MVVRSQTAWGQKLLHSLEVLFLMLQNLVTDEMVINSSWEWWEESATMLMALQIHQEMDISYRQRKEVLMSHSAAHAILWRGLCLGCMAISHTTW